MLFNSLEFLRFFLIVFVAYWLLPWHRARVWLLLWASLYFYAHWNSWLAGIIAVSTMVDYCLARGMDAVAAPRWRKAMLLASIVGNLGLLCYFKYANFFLHSLDEVLTAAGLAASLPTLRVILPIGISFYTFEAINYTVDVYRRRVPAERDLGKFMLFITFFPHLVAGPIVRAKDFLPQLHRPKRWSWPRLELGVQFLLMGFFKKLVIADRMALYADPVFAAPESYGTLAVWLAVLAYALQIYCDFSGYSDMAVGLAHTFGYKLVQNFNMPYLAVNVSDFWRRWHISLSTWLRDYLFFPLGGSRGSSWQTVRNLLIVMTLGGLWHGASWTFVVWGVLHGGFLVVHRSWQAFCQQRPRLDGLVQTVAGTACRRLVTFACVCVGWVFFRATTFEAAAGLLHRLVVPTEGLPPPLAAASLWQLGILVALCHVLAFNHVWKRLVVRLPAPAIGMSYASVLLVVMFLYADLGKVFIYFQF
jgi:alginate O-acetyltransferase complex protein AlgI